MRTSLVLGKHTAILGRRLGSIASETHFIFKFGHPKGFLRQKYDRRSERALMDSAEPSLMLKSIFCLRSKTNKISP